LGKGDPPRADAWGLKADAGRSVGGRKPTPGVALGARGPHRSESWGKETHHGRIFGGQ